MKRTRLRNLVFSAVCLAAALLLPFLTAQIPEIGSMLSPMHIPVLICGFVCGWRYGALTGIIAPLLRSFIFHMPPPYPTATAMAFELCAYGIIAGLLYRCFPKKYPFLYLSLIISMIGGRAVWGAAMTLITLTGGASFTFEIFLSSGFITALPGIVLHILVIPPVIYALQKSKFIEA